ncbi:hypothetical protein GH714_005361 [Hevea brasiliensis]|uniref:RRM domain-containing protein n=1 Tax=Hevea brasiliensis TaxID=3981 RepID=A0A6A6KAY3_HEVBR|nr:hypothetical protein GH714_005361 [Hevea brasiliensis]
MRDKTTGRPRGFGFVVFADPSILDRVFKISIPSTVERYFYLECVIYGVVFGGIEQWISVVLILSVEAKKALSREEQQTSVRAGNLNPARNTGNSGNIRTKKIFVGGLPPTLTDDGFRQYFEAYGHVTDVVLHKTFHDLNGKQVEVKRALPKDANPGGGSRSMGGGASGGGAGGGYQGYGASGGNSNSYDGRMDSNSPANNSVGYGGYGSYGGASAGYGGPAGAAYGNPNVPSPGYASGPPGAPRSSWSGQAPSGYGSMGYGTAASWGAPNTGAGSGGPGSTPAGQSPSGTAGYGNQGYGYGNYGGNDGSYGNPTGYGAVGGRSGGTPNSNVGGAGELQGSGSGYMGSGYGDANGNPGYGNAGWRSEPSLASGNYGTPQANGPHGGQVGYGGGMVVVLRLGKANNSDNEHIDANWIFIVVLWVPPAFLMRSSKDLLFSAWEEWIKLDADTHWDRLDCLNPSSLHNLFC